MAATVWDCDDSSLAERFRDRDTGALRTVYRCYARRMHTIARAMVRDRHEADDIVQQAFLQAWRAADRFDPSRALGPWLFQITRRACIDAYRRERRRPHLTANTITEDLPANEPPGLEQLWERWEVRRAVDQLPPFERDLVRLAHVDGLTHREIAERLDTPIGTVKSRAFRAYRHLRTALSNLAPATA
jgi:RNA polymerase sigma-70 factor (ECF subfamily)